MCTAISLSGPHHLAGRTLDLECSLGEQVVLTPRAFSLSFIHAEDMSQHHAILGIAHIEKGCPLYYDAINEKGLFAAGLNFPEYSAYHPEKDGLLNLASFEVIPYVLGRCANLKEAVNILKTANITPQAFSPDLPPTPLHWLIADSSGAVVVESAEDRLKVYDDPFGILANSPPFPYHTVHLADYSALSPCPPKNLISQGTDIPLYSRGLGAMGLPGDWSSASRFVRGVYGASHTPKADDRNGAISRFFHIADTVSVPLGCIKTDEGRDVYTVYTSCGDTSAFAYYFTTYDCRRIGCFAPDRTMLSGKELIVRYLKNTEDINYF